MTILFFVSQQTMDLCSLLVLGIAIGAQSKQICASSHSRKFALHIPSCIIESPIARQADLVYSWSVDDVPAVAVVIFYSIFMRLLWVTMYMRLLSVYCLCWCPLMQKHWWWHKNRKITPAHYLLICSNEPSRTYTGRWLRTLGSRWQKPICLLCVVMI